MNSSTLRRAIGAALSFALAGVVVAAPATASTDTEVDSVVAELGEPGDPTAAVEVLPAADLTLDQPAWDLFREVNLYRIDDGEAPVIRHGSLDSVARTWASYQASRGTLEVDPLVETKIPAGFGVGVQLMYRWAGTDVNEFFALIEENLRLQATLTGVTDSGIAVAKSSHGLFAYVLLVEYPHSTPAAGEMPLYRFYKPSAGTHFYSTSAGERNTVIGYPEYRYEGLVAYIRTPNSRSTTTPLRDLNRFHLRSAGTHFYTSSPDEYRRVLTYPQYSLDGVAGRVYAAPASGLRAMHRFFRPQSGTHFYTANAAEVESVKKIPGYTYEGVAFYLRVAS